MSNPAVPSESFCSQLKELNEDEKAEPTLGIKLTQNPFHFWHRMSDIYFL